MKYLFCALYVLVVILGCKSKTVLESESLVRKPPLVLSENGLGVFQYWEFEHSKYLFGDELGEIDYLKAYTDSIAKKLGPKLLKDKLDHQRMQSSVGIVAERTDDLSNFELVHRYQIGRIRNLNYIEAELLNYLAYRFPLFSEPTEFHGFILINTNLDRVRVYFGADGQPWPPKPKPIITHMEKALERGWKLMSHLHNHYEEPRKGYIGSMAPSLADVHYYKVLDKRFALKKALITNGFSTLVIQAVELEQLNSH